MTDIAIQAVSAEDAPPVFDVILSATGLAEDDGLSAAVIVSLFTDAVARPKDALPDGSTDRRGWWGNSFVRQIGDIEGSRLWLLSREKVSRETMARAEQYAREALRWLLDDGIARSVDVSVDRHGLDGISIRVVITRADGRVWDQVWINQVGAQ
ncbi:MAG: phage GP46 family protein [Gammaproteobacteria bacterium]|nr:phage GP46 family protein [Gammaproteobacteria bacterium]